MRALTFILILLITGISSFAQSISAGVSYNYLYSKQLDKSIQLYNFSRPFLENKQPLFINGITADVAFLFKNKKQIKHGIIATYSYFGSEAINENYTNRFNLHFINLNYVIRLSNEAKFKKLFGEIHVGLSSSALYRRVSGEFFLVDNEKSKSLGIGGNIGVKIGYQFYRHNMHQISPFIFFGYTPYLYAPKNEAVINATQELITKAYIYALNFRIGFTYEIIKKKRNDENIEIK
jgi:hypothetical protein